jgi:cysteine desulfurase / selenocysteine lyase
MTEPTTIDVKQVRRDTPACSSLIHFNNAGAGLTPQPVFDAYVEHLALEARIGSYEAGEQLAQQGGGFYSAAALLVNCQPDDIAFFDSASRGWNSLCHSAVLGLGIGPGDEVLVSASEYINNYMALVQLAGRHGFTVRPVECRADGAISPAKLEDALSDRVKLITLTHMPANSGLINPAAQVGAIVRAHDVPFLLDVAQTAGQVPLDVEALGCDMLVATGRKFLRGPRGTAFAYISPTMLDSLEVPTITNQKAALTPNGDITITGAAARFEIWETNIAARHALGVAIDYALAQGVDAIFERDVWLASRLRDKLALLQGVVVTDQGQDKGAIVCMALDKQDPMEIVRSLRERNINTTVVQPAQTFLDSQKRSLPPLLRASVHYYNTEAELDVFCDALEQVLA